MEWRFSVVKFVRCANPDTSETPVELRDSPSKFVKRANPDTSDIALLLTYSPLMYSAPRSISFKLIACSSPVRSLIPRFGACSCVKSSIVCSVKSAPGGRPRVSRMAAAKLASGIENAACTGGAVNCTKAVNNRVKVRSVNFFIWISPFHKVGG